MKAKKLFATALSALAFAQGAVAVPAYPGVIKAKQADGTEISIRIHGDEFMNYETTADGYPVFFNETTKNYEYAQLKNNRIVGSGIVAANADQRSAKAQAYLSAMDKAAIITTMQQQRENLTASVGGIKRSSAAGPRRILINNFPHFGEQHSLVILMQYKDKQFTTMDDPKQYYTNAMNQEGFTAENGANGSARDFFVASSHGQFKPTFDVYGPVTIDYGCHDAGQGTYNTTINMGTFVKAAVEGLDDEIDFSQYDHDGDGVVDNIYIFYAGNGSNDSSDKKVVWPHAFDLRSWGINLTTNDGVTIGSYTCSNEIDGQRTGMTTGIGTFVHEFGHCLGFPDLYNTENSSDMYNPGDWDTMASGSYNDNSNTPPLYSSYECYSLDWMQPEDLTARDSAINTLPNLGDEYKAYKVSVPGKDNEYYLIENRQQKGWDASLPAGGMLIWHIDENETIWENNTVNNVNKHQRVDLVEANGKLSGSSYYSSGVPFPGSTKKTSYDFTSWAGDELLSIDSIAIEDSVASFIIKGADKGIVKPQMAISNIKYNGFDASWPSVEGADSYMLNIQKVGEGDSLSSVAGYENLKITADTAVVTGLEQNTTYRVSLASRADSFISYDDVKTITTPEMPFTEDQVANVKAKNITSSSFEASWDAVDKAQQYAVTLSKHAYDGELATTAYDFTDRGKGLPDGWKTNSSNYLSSEGSYGQAAPSLRLSTNGSYLIASNGDAMINSISFWYNYLTSVEGSSLAIQTLTDGSWVTDQTIDLSEAKTETVTLNIAPTKSVRLYFNRKGSANLLLDDVSVSGNSLQDTPLEKYNNKNVGNTLTYQFDGLSAATEYSLSVSAINNGEYTKASNQLIVTTANATDGISNATAETAGAEALYDLSGRKLNSNAAANGVYILKQNGKTTKVAKH